MKKVHFYLRKNKSEAQTVYLCIRKGRNNSYRKSLGIKIRPSDWNKKKMRVKNTAKIKDIDLINSYLNEIENHLNLFFLQQKVKKQDVTLGDIKNNVMSFLCPEKAQSAKVLTYLRSYINQLDRRLSYKTGKPITRSTADKFYILYKLLKEFSVNHSEVLTFKDINMEFYHNFILFLQSKGYANNTVGKYISALKCVLNDAVIKGVSDNLIYKDSGFKSLNESPQSVYLTAKELDKIMKTQLPPVLSDYRKIFLVGCYTGLRYSDLSRLSDANISHNMITVKQKKTGSEVVIPMHTYIKDIMSDIGSIRSVSNVQLNKNIKRICQLAGLKDKIIREYTKGGNPRCEILEKWQLVCTHTARRTFATNLYLDGVPAITIMKITGHKSETAFLKYIKISQEENAKLLEKHWRKSRNKMQKNG